MTNRLYIDPSIVCLGWAHFIDGVFDGAGLIRPPAKHENRPAYINEYLSAVLCNGVYVDSICYEAPQLRARGSKNAAKPTDLFKLCMSIGAAASVAYTIMGDLPSLRQVKITDWKGQLPKEVTHAHMNRVLSTTERERLEHDLAKHPPSLRHNAYDAVCIGLYVEGRASWARGKPKVSRG